jgi:cytochrome c2
MTRRHPSLGLLLAIGVSLMAAFLAMLLADKAATMVNPSLEPSRFDDARGYQIFTSRCEVCHAKVEGDLSRMGPNLGRIGAEAATRRPGLNGPEYILESIMEPAAFTAPASAGAMMPANMVADLPDDDIRNLVAHVAGFGAIPNDEEIAALVIRQNVGRTGPKLVVRRDLLERGERVFREKCQSCHSVHNGAEHLVYAPAIFGVGFEDEEWLRDSIEHAKTPVSERYRSTRVVLDDGSVVVGNVIERSAEMLVLTSTRPQDRGEIITIDLLDVRKNAKGQPMLTEVGLPPGLSDVVASLTREEIDAVVALLKAFN